MANASTITTRCNIHIAKGNYYPTGVQSSTYRDSSFGITRSNIAIYGGYATGGGSRDPGSNITALNGDIGMANSNTDNSYRVVQISGSTAIDSVVIDGVTVVNGMASGAQTSGGGVIINTAVPVVFRTCTIKSNKALSGAAGISYNQTLSPGASLTIESCAFSNDSGGAVYTENNIKLKAVSSIFSNNYAISGAAIFARRPPMIRDCNFIGNKSSANGGALLLSLAGGTVDSIYVVNCTFTGNIAQLGGAVNSGASRKEFWVNCSFVNNMATGYGGAFLLAGEGTDTTHILNCTFDGNTAVSNGGAFASDQQGVIEISRCAFLNNSSGAYGGAVYERLELGRVIRIDSNIFTGNTAGNGGALSVSAPGYHFIENNTFKANAAANAGGAIHGSSLDDQTRIFNNSFSGNKATVKGGAVFDSASRIIMANSSFNGNAAAQGNGIFNFNTSAAILNCILWDGAGSSVSSAGTGTSTITNSIVQGGAAGAGNLSASPLFVASTPATAAPTAIGDLHVMPCSPAINAGSTYSYYNSSLFPYTPPTTDLSGNPRVNGLSIDMGAYEFIPAIPPIGGPDSICKKTTGTFTNTQAGGTWSVQDTSIARINTTGVVTGKNAGTTNIIYKVTDVNGCINSVVKMVRINGVNNNVTKTGSILKAMQDSATYKWLNCNTQTLVVGQTGQTFTTTATGQFAAIISRNGCVDTSACTTLNGVGVTNTALQNIVICPNPTNGIVVVRSDRPVDVIVTGIDGKLLLAYSNAEVMDVSKLSAGVYLVTVRDTVTRQIVATSKLVKQ